MLIHGPFVHKPQFTLAALASDLSQILEVDSIASIITDVANRHGIEMWLVILASMGSWWPHTLVWFIP